MQHHIINEPPYIFTFIIAYQHRLDRLNNLKMVVEWVLSFKGVELIIVEQDKSEKLKAFSLRGFKHIFIKSNQPFNKSWAFNVGLKNATTNIIIFGDSDLIMDSNEFIQSIRKLENFEAVSPYNRVIDLVPQENGLPIEQLNLINRPGRGETDIQKICLAGGIIMFRRDAIIKIGGFCEKFIGWGAEDDFVSLVTKRLLKWHESPGKCYHLYHEKVKPDMMYYQRNLQLLNTLGTSSDQDLIKHINASLPTIGMKNKYHDK